LLGARATPKRVWSEFGPGKRSGRQSRPCPWICLLKESLAPVRKTCQETLYHFLLRWARRPRRSCSGSLLDQLLVCKQWRGLVEGKSFVHSYFAHKRMKKTIKIMLVVKGTGRFRKGTGPRLFFPFSPLQNNSGW
jgi:hypothetical protein